MMLIIRMIIEKRNKYLDFNREQKTNKLWNMKVIVIPIVIGAPGTTPKVFVKGLEDLEIREQVETIQTTVLLRSARILRRFQDTIMNWTLTQIPEENYLLTLEWKILKGV